MVGDYSGRNNNTFIEGLADYVAVIEVGGDFRTLSIACTMAKVQAHAGALRQPSEVFTQSNNVGNCRELWEQDFSLCPKRDVACGKDRIMQCSRLAPPGLQDKSFVLSKMALILASLTKNAKNGGSPMCGRSLFKFHIDLRLPYPIAGNRECRRNPKRS